MTESYTKQNTDSNVFVYLEQINKEVFYSGKCSLGNPEFTKLLKQAKLLSVEEAIKIISELKDKGLIFITKLYKGEQNGKG